MRATVSSILRNGLPPERLGSASGTHSPPQSEQKRTSGVWSLESPIWAMRAEVIAS